MANVKRNLVTESAVVRQAAERLLEVVPQLMRFITSEAQSSDQLQAVTLPQLRVLGLLACKDRLPSELARELKITPATVSKIADLLVRRGLAERCSQSQDRRLTLLRISPTGTAQWRAAQEAMLAALGSLLAQFEPGELSHLQRELEHLQMLLRKHGPAVKDSERTS